jgi:hypothetical protein
MKKLIKTNYLYLVGGVAGAIAGLLYWQQIGCSNGHCAITSHPVNSTVYGTVTGALFFGIFKK